MDVYYKNELLNSKESCTSKYDNTTGFRYIKFSNGLAIIIGSFSVDTNGKAGTYTKNVNYPFDFYSNPALSLSVEDHDCTVYASSRGMFGFNVSLNLKKASSVVNAIVDFFAIGRYK